jgi:hypothetical protein
MEFDAGEIKELVAETEKKRAPWSKEADKWEEAWRLIRYDEDTIEKREMDGIRTVTLPDPFNIIQVAQRMTAEEVRLTIPSLSVKDDDDKRGQEMEEWGIAFDFESNRQQGRNNSNDKTYLSTVLGRGASQVLWIGDVLEKEKIKDVLPIYRRNLDPRNVGVVRGPYWTEYAYHTYETTRNDIKQRYSKFKLPDDNGNQVKQGYFNEKYKVIDFYYRKSGSIWHCVVINGEFAKKPAKTDYHDIPIIEWYADGALSDNELAKSVGLLHPILESWKAKCDLGSSLLTGIDYHLMPVTILRNIEEQLKVGPGATIKLYDNQSIEFVRGEPNVPMVQNMVAMLQTGIDQATFSTQTYGDEGGASSGYAINSLAASSRARMNVIRNNIEAAMEAEYQLIYGIIDRIAPEEGVTIYGRASKEGRGKPLTLRKKDIKGNYANRVILVPEQPMDDNARIMAWLQVRGAGLIDDDFFRDHVLNTPMPRDIAINVALDEAMKSPEMAAKKHLASIKAKFPHDVAMKMISGTPLQQVHEAEEAWQEQYDQQKEAEKEARRAEKEQIAMEEQMAAMMASMPPMDLLGTGLGQPMGGSPMSLPPIPPTGDMMPPGLGMPPDPSMQPPGLQGMPPEAMGQMTPESLGLQDAPPGTFDQMMGQPQSDMDLMRQMGALPPEM